MPHLAFRALRPNSPEPKSQTAAGIGTTDEAVADRSITQASVRSAEAQDYVDRYYEPFDRIREEGLDALIVTGANVVGPELANQPFWEPLKAVIDWASVNVTSTLCSCLATHAVLLFRYGQPQTHFQHLYPLQD